jgi:peptide methionine sulfoxide reductase MsrA
MGAKKFKKKKIKYRSIIFKVTDKQKQIIDDYCKKNGLGTVQLFKLAMREFIERNASYVSDNGDYTMSENQLSIFDVISELERED